MATVKQVTDLYNGPAPINGWETNAARSGDVVVYTGNWFAAWSGDGGRTFRQIDVAKLCARYNEALCCDQVVTYVPEYDLFCWVMQTAAGNYVLAVASSDEVAWSNGTRWTTYLLRGDAFGVPGGLADYPEVSYGNSFLYLAFSLIGNHGIGLRLRLTELAERTTLHLEYIATTSNYWLRPVQATGPEGYFVSTNSASQLRVFRWGEQDHWFNWFDVSIPTIPTEDWVVGTPTADWLVATSKIDWHIQGATRSQQRYIWIAWPGARQVSGQPTSTFAFPHIGVAVIDLQTQTLADMQFIWNPEYAYSWPALATNGRGEVGLSFCYGGPGRDAQHGVGILTLPKQSYVFAGTTSGPTNGAGGHYISIRRSSPDDADFDATAFVQRPGATPVNHPQFVVFSS